MKVLLVEDSFLARERETKVLKNLGHKVVQACDGDEAVKLFKAEKPDVVITDLDMPYLGGQDAIKEIRKLNPKVPILVCSSSADKQQLMSAMQAGASEILGKPLDPNQLQTALSNARGRI
ncbi:MAG: response regulator [Armatimonadetes bacterium]|nr:response regulator [Armatimonadota bacterium]